MTSQSDVRETPDVAAARNIRPEWNSSTVSDYHFFDRSRKRRSVLKDRVTQPEQY